MSASPWYAATPPSLHGAAGQRLQRHHVATLPDPQLREFAQDHLGACRVGAGYLQALRVVLGNQANAERYRYPLEMNVRTDFASERVIRNIIDQMKEAGITEGRRVGLGGGRVQTVQVFMPAGYGSRPRLDLCTMLRLEEAMAEAKYGHLRPPSQPPANLADADVPF